MAIIILDRIPSTNTWTKEHAAGLRHGDVVITHCQTAGRGQRGNTWEAEPGRNLTFSLLLRPVGLLPAQQFTVSEIVALAVADTLRSFLGDAVPPAAVSIKWPNDIYVGDRKIAGILIENTISGNAISHSVAGIGLNVNQRRFISDAPNPVSMWQLSGREYPLEDILSGISGSILAMLADCDPQGIHASFLASLWRHDGKPHPFATPHGEVFEATIADVSPCGMLRLRRADGTEAEYAFKEVAFLL